ncbi:MAG: cysteine peptidase family C39 domain-containing protein [Armatimonadota bacterium]
MIVPTLVLAVALFWGGQWLVRRCRWAWQRIAMWGMAVLLAVPGLLITAYYGHFFDNAQWFYEFRAQPFSELSAAGMGLLAGMLQVLVGKHRLVVAATRAGVLGLMLFWLAIPYAKSLLMPATLLRFEDRWEGDICLQTQPATCGPSSAATLLRAAGVPATERELAIDSFATFTGTENWYLARALRKRGFTVHYRILPTPLDKLPYPAIAGTNLHSPHGPGHFVAVLGEENGQYIIGDPLVGKVLLRKEQFDRVYWFSGFFMVVSPK